MKSLSLSIAINYLYVHYNALCTKVNNEYRNTLSIFTMTKKQYAVSPPMWVAGELRLAGALDNRII
ncbi:MAG: hypothetical protein QX198_13805, partial [Methylococcaceae bacterium]